MGTISRLVTAAGLGAAAMYFYDPQRGNRRRALLRDKLTRLANVSDDALDAVTQDLGHRMQGWTAELRALRTPDEAPDQVIVARVRSRLGRVCSHPGAVEVTADNGHVTLSGPVLADEVDLVLARTAAVRGVRGLTNTLRVYRHASDIPGLQGGVMRPDEEPAYLHRHWSPAGRLVASMAGCGMALYGLLRGGLAGTLVGVPGAMLFLRGVTDMPIRDLTGLGAGRSAVYHQKEIDVQAPVEAVYQFWRQVENFPRIFSHVDEVRETGPGRTHWVVSGPAGTRFDFDAVTTELIPDELIAWESTPGSELQNKGIVRFKEAHHGNQRGGTRINIRMWYTPPAGAIGDTLAGFLDSSLKNELDQAMVRLKSLLDLGATSSHGQRVTRQELETGRPRPRASRSEGQSQQQTGEAPTIH